MDIVKNGQPIDFPANPSESMIVIDTINAGLRFNKQKGLPLFVTKQEEEKAIVIHSNWYACGSLR